jgi:polar amino acid transport system substrate-binding protein
MKFRKIVIGALIVLSFSTVFAACKKEETDSLKRIEDAGEFTVVGSGGYPPFNYMEDGKVVGFDVDTGAEIAKRLGVELNYVTSDWDGLTEGLRNKRYDGILGSMAITDERLEVVDFTIPYYYSGAQLFVNKDAEITDLSQMSEKKIAVATGTNFVQDAEELGAEVSYYQDDNATLMELINGRVDGVITDRLVGISAMDDIAGGENIILVGNLLRLENMGIAINKDDTELLERVNTILQEMHDDGTLTKISEKWLGGEDITVK